MGAHDDFRSHWLVKSQLVDFWPSMISNGLNWSEVLMAIPLGILSRKGLSKCGTLFSYHQLSMQDFIGTLLTQPYEELGLQEL